jgi:hypothetical protein
MGKARFRHQCTPLSPKQAIDPAHPISRAPTGIINKEMARIFGAWEKIGLIIMKARREA